MREGTSLLRDGGMSVTDVCPATDGAEIGSPESSHGEDDLADLAAVGEAGVGVGGKVERVGGGESLVHGLAFLYLDGKFPASNPAEVDARVTSAIVAILTLQPN